MAIRNHTTTDGHEHGEFLARMCDEAEPKARLVEPAIPPRCQSCAFRAGKHLANGSPYTQLDALKSVMEQTPFLCHDVHRQGEPCSGWVMLTLAYPDSAPLKMPWEFSEGADA